MKINKVLPNLFFSSKLVKLFFQYFLAFWSLDGHLFPAECQQSVWRFQKTLPIYRWKNAFCFCCLFNFDFWENCSWEAEKERCRSYFSTFLKNIYLSVIMNTMQLFFSPQLFFGNFVELETGLSWQVSKVSNNIRIYFLDLVIIGNFFLGILCIWNPKKSIE